MHDPLPVKGYQPQTEAKVRMVNEMKEMEEHVLQCLDVLANMQSSDKRWLAIGRTAIEQGFMAVNRSIFCPERVTLG